LQSITYLIIGFNLLFIEGLVNLLQC